MISRILRRRRFHEYRNERSFLTRNINELERRKVEAELHLKTNKEKLSSIENISVFVVIENRYWEKELAKLEVAIEEYYEQLRELTKKNREYINTI